ncbi:PEP-CTERM sorting domain-containing protein [Thermogutta sp.]|uniref:PEP-CTERM sorting domain-containing protein n=1 Tax=Thermogutta sp. TaxID=1962930 RepID=UPI003C7B7140
MRAYRVLGLLAFVGALSLWGSQIADAAIVWVNPDDYPIGSQITPPFVTLTAVLGNTSQNPPDGRVLALVDDKGHYPSTIHFFGWHVQPPVNIDQVAWRGKWANLQAVFDSPVSYVAMDFYRNDFSGGPSPDEIGFILAFDASNNLIWNEWVYLQNFEDWKTVEISLSSPQIKKIVAGGVYVSKSIDQDILIRRLGYSIEPIPEPSVLVLLAGGAGALAILRGRKRIRAT